MTGARSIEVAEATQAGEARREAMSYARGIGFDDVETGRVGIVVSEAATNMVKHAQGGRLLVQPSADDDGRGLEALALDVGPGMANLPAMMRDGTSTGATPGTGLGAIQRQSGRFDIWTAPARGTAVYAGFWRDGGGPAAGALRVGGVCVPIAGETHCGDDWAIARRDGRLVVFVVDGVGHGAVAHEAATAARATFAAHAAQPLDQILARVHDALRSTRGAAAALAEIDPGRGVVRFCGVGNIVARLFGTAEERQLVSQFGTLGHEARRITEFQYPWSPGSVLVLHSDGLTDHWKLEDYAGLIRREPALIAGVLFRDHARKRDDCTVVVVRDES